MEGWNDPEEEVLEEPHQAEPETEVTFFPELPGSEAWTEATWKEIVNELFRNPKRRAEGKYADQRLWKEYYEQEQQGAQSELSGDQPFDPYTIAAVRKFATQIIRRSGKKINLDWAIEDQQQVVQAYDPRLSFDEVKALILINLYDAGKEYLPKKASGEPISNSPQMCRFNRIAGARVTKAINKEYGYREANAPKELHNAQAEEVEKKRLKFGTLQGNEKEIAMLLGLSSGERKAAKILLGEDPKEIDRLLEETFGRDGAMRYSNSLVLRALAYSEKFVDDEEGKQAKAAIKQILFEINSISDKGRMIIEGYYGFNDYQRHFLRQIGEMDNVTRQAVLARIKVMLNRIYIENLRELISYHLGIQTNE